MVLLTSSAIEQIRERVAREPWAAAVLAAVRSRADAWLVRPGAIPAAAGGWMHDYVCPEHWSALSFDPDSPQMHRCPAGEVRRGDSYDAAWRVLRHRQIAALARDLGLVHAIAQAPGYGSAAAQILADYAGHYDSFAGGAEARPWMLTGRAFQQALTEALWAIPLVQAYESVRAALDADEDALLRQRLLFPIAGTLTAAQERLVFEQGKLRGNYNAWLIAALGCLGFALNDDMLVERALDARTGFRAHLPAAILADGFEYEGSLYYHTFVALAYSILAERARAAGVDLYAERGPQGQSIAATWRALPALAMPDGTLPYANDGAYWSGGPFDAEICEVCEIALARTGDPAFAWLLDRAYARRNAPRDQWTALLYGMCDITGARAPARGSTCLEAIGLAVLRDRGEAPAQAVCVPFGPYGGAHGHMDRLAIQVWPWSIDAGTPPYGAEVRMQWYQQTAAHNAVVVDGRSQRACQGQLLEWELSLGGGRLRVAAHEAYPGVRFTREVTLERGVLIDDQVLEADEEHTYDWILHADGEIEPSGALLEAAHGPLGSEGFYRFVTLRAVGSCSGTFAALIRHAGATYWLTLDAHAPFVVYLAYSPGLAAAPHRRRQMLIARVQGRNAHFLATSTPFQQGNQVSYG